MLPHRPENQLKQEDAHLDILVLSRISLGLETVSRDFSDFRIENLNLDFIFSANAVLLLAWPSHLTSLLLLLT